MRLLRTLLLALVGLISFSTAQVASMPAPSAYVDDFANVMTPDGKAGIESICREVHDKTRAQIFLVTVKSLQGDSIETFANQLFHQWKIGEQKTDRGILLLLAVQEHKRRIEVGYGLEGILNDAKVGRIGRDMVPALKSSDYDEAGLIGVKAIASVIAEDSHVVLTTLDAPAPNEAVASQPAPPDAASSSDSDGGFNWVIPLVLALFLGALVLRVWQVARRRGGGSGGTGFYRGSNGSTGFYAGSSGTDLMSGDSTGTSGSDFTSGSGTDSTTSSSDSLSGGDGGDSGGGGASGDW